MKTTKQILMCTGLFLGMTLSLKAQTNVYLPPNDNTKGSTNVIVGKDSGNATTAGSVNNVFVGVGSGQSVNGGNNNVFLGPSAGNANVTGNRNVAIGSAPGIFSNGDDNISIGTDAARFNTGSTNIHIGTSAGYGSGGGDENIVVGREAGVYNKGSRNIFIGNRVSQQSPTITTHLGTDNIFIGNRAGSWDFLNEGANQLVIQNAVSGGTGANTPLVYGHFDTQLLALNADVTINSKTALAGYSGLFFGALNSSYNPPAYNTNNKLLNVNASGEVVLQYMNAWSLTGNVATVPGTNFLGTTDNVDLMFKRNNLQSGLLSVGNTAFGVGAYANSTTGTDNVAIGTDAARRNVASGNTAVGVRALAGSATLASNTGEKNVAMGWNTLQVNTAGKENVAIGYNTMSANTTGNDNVSVGMLSMVNNINGGANVALGTSALGSNTNGSNNVAVGQLAGYASKTISGVAGKNNVYLGYQAGRYNEIGEINTFLGFQAGLNNKGKGNVFIGADAGGNTANATDNNKLFIMNSNATDPLIYGDFSTRFLKFNVSGATATSMVEILGPATTTDSGLKLTNLNVTTSVGDNVNNNFLTVDNSGYVVLKKLPAAVTAHHLNFYEDDHYLDTTTPGSPNTGLRTVTMGENNLFFKTNGAFEDESAGTGRIYIGKAFKFPNIVTPTSQYRLLVEGGILTEKVKVALRYPAVGDPDNWADYVFADTYKLMPLEEVEAFVKTNKHLPGIESSEELHKSGLDLADMQKKQMEKIEELTLHLIDQNKTIEKQSKEIEVLKEQVTALLAKK